MTHGKTEMTLELPAASGKILAIYPQTIGNVEVVAPKSIIVGKETHFTIRLFDDKNMPVPGVQPIKVIITDPKRKKNEYSGYFSAIDGVAEIKFIPAVNDLRGEWTLAVTELSSGLERSIKFKMP